MKIAIDYREAIRKNKAGKGVVVFELVQELKRIIDKDWSVDLLVDDNFDFKDFPDNFRKVVLTWPSMWWHWQAANFVRKNCDLYLTLTSYIAPFFLPKDKAIIMVHDLVAFKDELALKHNKKALMVERWLLPRVVSKVKKIIVPSVSTKNDLINLFGVGQDRIEQIDLGVNLSQRDFTDIDVLSVKKKFGVEGDYLYFVGTLEPRKNLVRLVEGYARLLEEKKWEGKLVISGKKGWYYDEIFAAAEKNNLKDKVIFTGFVTDEEKFVLIKGAKCLCYLSLYEGFGLPILEGMAMGTPVVAANNSSLPEVAGEMAILVDPTNIDEIVAGLTQVVFDKTKRQEMIIGGYERVKKYTWEKAARKINNLINN